MNKLTKMKELKVNGSGENLDVWRGMSESKGDQKGKSSGLSPSLRGLISRTTNASYFFYKSDNFNKEFPKRGARLNLLRLWLHHIRMAMRVFLH